MEFKIELISGDKDNKILENIHKKNVDHLFNIWRGAPYVVYNPFDKHISQLPYVIGFFSYEDQQGMLVGHAISEDGYILEEVRVEEESWFWIELGLIANHNEKVQHKYRKHYPHGFRCVFIRENEKLAKNYLILLLEKRLERLKKERE